MKDFEQWYKELISEERWHETMQMQHRGKDLKEAARIVYGDVISDSQVFARTPIAEHRRFVHYKAAKMPVKQQAPVLQQVETKEENKEWKPASPEHVDKCVAEFDEMMKNAPMNNAFPRIGYKQQIEEGGWLPKKDAPYPATSRDELYIKERRFQYIKANYEPRTGKPLPNWISEQEYNYQFDNGLL